MARKAKTVASGAANSEIMQSVRGMRKSFSASPPPDNYTGVKYPNIRGILTWATKALLGRVALACAFHAGAS